MASRVPKEIMSREVELGVVSFKPKDKFVKSVSVSTDELLLIVPQNHSLANKKIVSIKDLETENFIAHNAPSPYRKQVIDKFENYKTPLNISIEMPSLEAIKKLVEMGAGVALVPKLTAQNEITSGILKGLSVKEMRLKRRLHIVYRRNGVLTHAAKRFLKLVKEM